jgi:hypothetical protein
VALVFFSVLNSFLRTSYAQVRSIVGIGGAIFLARSLTSRLSVSAGNRVHAAGNGGSVGLNHTGGRPRHLNLHDRGSNFQRCVADAGGGRLVTSQAARPTGRNVSIEPGNVLAESHFGIPGYVYRRQDPGLSAVHPLGDAILDRNSLKWLYQR